MDSDWLKITLFTLSVLANIFLLLQKFFLQKRHDKDMNYLKEAHDKELKRIDFRNKLFEEFLKTERKYAELTKAKYIEMTTNLSKVNKQVIAIQYNPNSLDREKQIKTGELLQKFQEESKEFLLKLNPDFLEFKALINSLGTGGSPKIKKICNDISLEIDEILDKTFEILKGNEPIEMFDKFKQKYELLREQIHKEVNYLDQE